MDDDNSGEIAYNELFSWLVGEDEDEDRADGDKGDDEPVVLVDAPAPEKVKVMRTDTPLRQKPSVLLLTDPENLPGQRVALAGQNGTVQFVGETHFAPGTWVGVALDKPFGKNNGSVDEKRYFDCKQGHGIFVRLEVATELLMESYSDPTKMPSENVCAACGNEPGAQEELVTDPSDGRSYCASCWVQYSNPVKEDVFLPLVPLGVLETLTEDSLKEAWSREPLPDWPPPVPTLSAVPVPEASKNDWATMLVCLRNSVVGQHARDGFESDRPQLGEVLRSRYLIRSELGEGNYARALLAEDQKTRGMVCVKRHKNNLTMEEITDFMVVAQRVEDADPKEMFFPRLLDAFFDVSSFTVETLIQGQNCLAMAKINPRFFDNVKNVQIVACDCLQGLRLLEVAGVVHNDLKADNLIWAKQGINKRPSVKIVDFGCARLDQRETPGRNWDLAEGGQGHLGKWPPEMIFKLPITHVADVWGLTVTLCELHSGRRMWRDDKDTSEYILAQALGICNARLGVPKSLLKQSSIDIYSCVTPGPRHFPVCYGAGGSLDVLEPTEWGIDQILGNGWEKTDKDKFGELLETALVINPNDRPAASNLLTKCSFVNPKLVGNKSH